MPSPSLRPHPATRCAAASRRLLAALVLAVAALGGCQAPPPRPPTEAPADVVKGPLPGAVTPSPASAPHGAAGHECSAEAPPAPAAVPRLSLQGGDSLAAGQKLAGLPAVTVAQLAAQPAAYAGTRVRVEGKISTLCHHRRGWFAVRDAAAPEGPAVRIITAPNFLVPENAIGRLATAEGQVEVVAVPAETARYFAQSHGLGNPEAYNSPQPVKQVIVRAVGAEFR